MSLLYGTRAYRAIAGFCLGLLLTGCGDVMVFSDEGMVKRRIELLAQAIAQDDWQGAASHFDSKLQWQTTSGATLKGAAAVKAFFAKIRNIEDRDNFFIEIHKTKQTSETKVVAAVTFQAHVIVSSMALEYSNFVWNANMLWIKRGVNDWRILGVKDTSEMRERKNRPPGGA